MDVQDIYGSHVFSDSVMRSRLPAKAYQSLKATLMGEPLDPDIADVVATTMKDWAVQMGATHFSHWFQPLSGLTAGKHDSFISPTGDGKMVTEFSSSALVRGEPDASSFPSGGLRATFEARGYTSWDPTSPAFVRDGTLYIPTAFSSYTGEALDGKTPLLRSMQALSAQALRILRALGNTTSRVVAPTVGAEQEYFLIDREKYEQRLDLKLCGRTLFGAKPPKGQELDDHYCGRLRLRVGEFMRALDEQLWRLGVPSKTKHNEVAPCQHELAPVYETVNIACDHNLLTMEVLRTTAKRHGLTCLLHEKPFQDISGSGKHNNFSIGTDDGINFLSPGKHPEENKLFLLTLCALIQVVDEYADLIRMTAATPGNRERLGGHEAPPVIISMFLGEQLTSILTSIAQGIDPEVRKMTEINADIQILMNFRQDDSDRNRTSPIAFTGNKFEFRMLASSQSIALCNTVFNAAVSDVFRQFADRLESSDQIEEEVAQIIGDTIRDHSRVIFNGNNYTQEWVAEAKRRGLRDIRSTLDAFDCLVLPKNIELFKRTGVFSEAECQARYDIMLENYIKIISIEAETMLQMAKRQIFPAVMNYLGKAAVNQHALRQIGVSNSAMTNHVSALSQMLDHAWKKCEDLEKAFRADFQQDLRSRAQYIDDTIVSHMRELRESCDHIEEVVDAAYWPMPTYTDLLHRV